MERIGATESSEAIRMPLSQIQAVSRRDHVGSPLAFPWPKIWRTTQKNTQTPLLLEMYIQQLGRFQKSIVGSEENNVIT